MFTARQPRRFRRVSIYTDERKEKLQKLVEQVKREKGETAPGNEVYDTNKFKGTFHIFKKHLAFFCKFHTLIAS